jgi:hypothetical protein
MSDQRGRFHPSELDVALDADSAELLATARDLEAYAQTGSVVPTPGFEDRVMAAIADEPMPRPSTRRGSVGFVRDAWAAAFGAGRPLAVRAQGLALLLLLAVAVGSVGGVVVVGAGRLLSGPVPTPPTLIPSPSPLPSPSTSPPPSPTPTVSPSPSPTETPSPSVRPTATGTDDAEGTEEPEGTDDNSGPGGGGGPGSGSDSSGPGSGGVDSARSGSGSDDEPSSGPST